jgi:hypothetical protein
MAQDSIPEKYSLELNIGLSFYKNPFKDNILNNDFPYVSKCFMFGFNFINNTIDVGISVRKTLWYFISTGVPGQIGGTGSFDNIGILKRFGIRKEWQMELGYSWIRENGYHYVHYGFNNINQKKINSSGLYNHYFRSFFNTYTSTAVSLSLLYRFLQKVMVELRGYFYDRTYHPFFVKGINENRIHISVYFNLNPNRKKSHTLIP